jgi:hypothetical protein
VLGGKALRTTRDEKLRSRFLLPTKKAAFTAALFDELDSSFNRGAHRAHPRAGTTGNTGFGINNILAVALGNRTDRAFTLAGATADALIGDYISHVKNAPPLL